jgi:hypothetical protein
MFESKINRGKANGYAPLDGSGKVPLSKLPPIQSTIDTGSFATTGSNTFTGTQTISGSDGSLTIGSSTNFGINTFDLRASGSEGSTLFISSDGLSLIGAVGTDISGDASIFSNQLNGDFVSDGPIAGITIQKSGSIQSNWFYNYDGKSAFPGDITIGYNQLNGGLTSGSLNITKGNINLSGSLFVSGNIYANNLTGSTIDTTSLATTGSNVFRGNQSISGSIIVSSSLVISSTIVNSGSISALNSDLIIDGGDIILSGSFAQQVNYAPFGSGSWETQAIGEVTELDITKDIHLLDTTGNNGLYHWYLPDGLYDGQVVRFALVGDNDTNPSYVKIWMNNLRTYNGTIQSSQPWHPFYCGEGQGPCRSLGTAIFIDGAWNIDTDWWDM